ncbi:hypothetical protein [Actinomadura parmotrematis]|uniref:Sigma-70 family RNA polymerase sigma factor n=1 Tax=Actinomadura parmotrematis TaxID=2864039 RepID=A0ABS7FXR7_9ACTN|nr:hypothetical protein [Actinomadura parmotrematis]MBW8484392.1 hypothetical protein [Actinomadura parmotrematis]
MRGDLGSLYDAHADRLYAHCWSLLGDAQAAAAVTDAFAAAVRHPPRGDSVLWLYSLSRSACTDRGAFDGAAFGTGDGDALVRAASALRADHREALLLWAGDWLEPGDIARVLGVAPDTARDMLHAARTRLERGVLDILMRGATGADLELITAFEKGRLPQLLARRAPDRAPAWLRERVLALGEDGAQQPLAALTAPAPLVVIGRPPVPVARARRGLSKGFAAAAGIAASVVAAVGLLASWPAARGVGVGAATPTSGESDAATAQQTSAAPVGTARTPAPNGPATVQGTAAQEDGGDPVSATASAPPSAPGGGAPAQGGDGGGGVAAPPPSNGTGSAPAPAEPPAASEPSEPSAPADPPDTSAPAEPPATSEPPAEETPPAEPSDPPAGAETPAPTENPAPAPSG